VKLSSALPVAQATAGAIITARPEPVARLAAGRGRPAPSLVVRLLGSRMLVQGVVTAAVERRGRDIRTALRAGAMVDLAHAASMFGAAVWKPQYRRSALASGGAAGLSAGLGLMAAERFGH
jgi:hypothetical protein